MNENIITAINEAKSVITDAARIKCEIDTHALVVLIDAAEEAETLREQLQAANQSASDASHLAAHYLAENEKLRADKQYLWEENAKLRETIRRGPGKETI